jgi:hypothetical protein
VAIRSPMAPSRGAMTRVLSLLSLITLMTVGGGAPAGLSALSTIENSLPPLRLDLPVACRLTENCWVVNYVDVDPTEAAQDFRCGPRTYNTHDGVDIALRDRAMMEAGVPVLASAPGLVRRVRDGMEDHEGLTASVSKTIAGRDCGNGVVLDHPDSWQTQYCHLKRGSLRVTNGEVVERGTVLGLVGFSGRTEFPHVHLTVRHQRQVMDPFTGHPSSDGCGQGGRALWQSEEGLTYEPVALYLAGFAEHPPDVAAIRRGMPMPASLTADAPALILWVDMFGVQAGDHLRFQLTDPSGRLILDQEQRLDRTQARRFAFLGKQQPRGHWPSGSYVGVLTWSRVTEGETLQRSVTRMVVVQ